MKHNFKHNTFKPRRVWGFNPETRIKGSKKAYDRVKDRRFDYRRELAELEG